MANNVLKKEFQKRDVERLRNLVKGKHGDRSTMGIGYNGETQEDHKEGDVWEEKGKTWTIRDGIRENVTKLDKIKMDLRIGNYEKTGNEKEALKYYKKGAKEGIAACQAKL